MSTDQLSAEELERYQAHLALPGFGVSGQQRLRAASVLLIGVGGLGCPAALYLAAAGVGRLKLVDDDVVDRTNLQRQVLFGDADIGRTKVEAAAERLAQVNHGVSVEFAAVRVLAGNARELVAGHDLVLDGTDNFASRFVINDACTLERVPLVGGSLYRTESQVAVFAPPETPCYRCVFSEAPAAEAACRDVGILGPMAGVAGATMAVQAVEHLAGHSAPLLGKLLMLDAGGATTRVVQLDRDPGCALCGDTPTIQEPTALDRIGDVT
ncbi:MAG: molybdopterin-synthase adenylyltransferase MoeB [Acidobacteria bacterium]|nr:molybdopterin-synthase adenylyltransferase MoeB [Acidobacteriota bacterium]